MIPADEFYEGLGAAIKARREALGLNQADLAKRIGLSRTSITNIERGRQRLLVDQFCRVSEILKCDRDFLLAGLAAIVSSQRQPTRPDMESMPTSVTQFVESLNADKGDAP